MTRPTLRHPFLATALVLLLLPILARAADSSASKAADTYLRGMRLYDLPEGKQMVAENSWLTAFPDIGTKVFPSYTEINTLFEGDLSVDTPGVLAYKRLCEVKLVSKAGTPLIKTYLLVAFRETSSSTWRVYWFQPSADADKAALEFREYAEGKKQWAANISSHAYDWYMTANWYLLAGKMREATDAIAKARVELPREKPAGREKLTNEIEQLAALLVRISPAKALQKPAKPASAL